jgi:phosphogluconate dehydratase
MCDGVTQGQPGMELSLFSRDVIALAAGVALSAQHLRRRDLYLGICDKIVPGLIIAAPPSAICRRSSCPPGRCPAACRTTRNPPSATLCRGQGQPRRADGGRDGQLPRPGTCTFYGTANTNQMLMEVMGLHLPGASFVNPGTALRER